MFMNTWKGRSFDLGRMTLRELTAAYFTYYAIQAYLALGIAATLAALWLATSALAIIASVVAAILIYPVVWYLLHRFVLHGEYLYKWSVTAPVWKRIHFDHHQDPHKLEVLFGALHTTLPTILLASAPVGYLIGGPSGALAAFAAGLFTTCVYEWIHCIQHLNFTPRNPILKRMKDKHLWHHFHHEDGNYGITTFAVDKLFGTNYDRANEVPRSEHVFDLGYDVEMSKRYPWVAELSGHPPRSRPPKRGPAVEA
ncbi:MAG: sterol desaturase family protein [Pseudomonadota bacterium]